MMRSPLASRTLAFAFALALAACGGGASGTGGAGGTGGAVPCAAPADCPQPENDCQLAACNGGACGLEPKPEGALCLQGAGTCDGNGQCNLCEPGFATCNGSTLLVCGESGTFDDPITCSGDTPYCDPADPKCVGCFDTSQCVTPGMNPCLAVACLENACVTTLVPDGAACVANGATGVCSDGMCLQCAGGAGSNSDCPATSCDAILGAGDGTADGYYWLDPDATGSSQIWCDMTTDGGGWTMVWTHDGVTNLADASLSYDFWSSTLFNEAQDVLIGHVDASATMGGTWASFPLPDDWRRFTPMAYFQADISVDAVVAGAIRPGITLRYGYSDFASTGAGYGCMDMPWNSSDTYGRVCLDDVDAPFFSGFCTDMASSSSIGPDYCSTGAAHNGSYCSNSNRFAILVR